MKRFLLCVCLCLLAVVLAPTSCVADTANGVIAKERVVTLPQDQGKWFVSVVGSASDTRYKEVLSWFDSGSLLKLRNSTHFNAVTFDSAIYKERYAENTPALPMVRLQNSEGVVYSQICGSDLPMTADSLNAMIADDVKSGPKTESLFPLLPWRRNHNCPTPSPQPMPQPKPQPNPSPDLPDLTPGPLDTPTGPAIDTDANDPPSWVLALLCLGGFTAGAVYSVAATNKSRLKPTK